MRHLFRSVKSLSAAFCLFSCFSAFTFSEILKIPVGQQGSSSKISLPERGQTALFVKQIWGPPISSRSIGSPVISSWEYSDFWVYFEDNLVLHTVLNHAPSKTKTKAKVAPDVKTAKPIEISSASGKP